MSQASRVSCKKPPETQRVSDRLPLARLSRFVRGTMLSVGIPLLTREGWREAPGWSLTEPSFSCFPAYNTRNPIYETQPRDSCAPQESFRHDRGGRFPRAGHRGQRGDLFVVSPDFASRLARAGAGPAG